MTLSKAADGGETVDYATSEAADPSHATAGLRLHQHPRDADVHWGQTGQTSRDDQKTIAIPLHPDSSPSRTTRTSASRCPTPTGLQPGDPNPAKVTIVDDDGPGTLAFSALRYDANESDGHATVTVRRIGGSGGAVSVDYATSDGSATAPADYASHVRDAERSPTARRPRRSTSR